MDDLVQITLLSLGVSGIATAISLLIGLPLGTVLALSVFRSRGLVLSVVNTGMALPPVVAGLAIALMLWRSGPLGGLNLIYTPTAIVIAEVSSRPLSSWGWPPRASDSSTHAFSSSSEVWERPACRPCGGCGAKLGSPSSQR